MKKSLFLCGLILNLALAAYGQTIIDTNWIVNTLITPGNPVGVPISETLPPLPDVPITSVAVTLDISGGYNGALYGALTLQESDGTIVTETLLNQMGTTPSNLFGSSGAGLNVTLSDTGTANGSIHNASGTPTGLWLPDSANSLNGTFSGMNANGTWTLYLADLDSGTPAPTLVSWGLVVAVPEPASVWVAALGGLLLLAGRQLLHRRQLSSETKAV